MTESRIDPADGAAPVPRALRWLAGPRALRWAILIAIALCIPSLGLGLVADDLPQQRFVRAHLSDEPPPTPWWDLFDGGGRGGPLDIATRVFTGTLPWWTSPDLRVAFLRPLSVATHFLDQVLWPEAPWLMHLHNVAWYALIVLLAGLLYRQLRGPGLAAGVAIALYAIDEAHIDGASWIAGRNTLLSAAFALLALFLYERALRTRSSVARVLCPIALLLGLASGESALAVWAYFAAHALCLDERPWKARLESLSPCAVVTIAWLALAASRGYRAEGSGLYVDPRSDPAYFLVMAAQRFPAALRAQLTLPAELSRLLPAAGQRLDAIIAYALIAGVAALAWRLLRTRPLARFYALGMLGSAVTLCAGGAEPRLLFLMGFGGHGLIAELLCAPTATTLRGAWRGLRTTVIAAMLLLHVPVALATGPASALIWSSFDATVRRAAATLPSGPGMEDNVILVLNVPDFLRSMFVNVYRIDSGVPGPAVMHVLGATPQPVTLHRPEANVFVLEPEGGYLREHSSQLVRKPSEPFRAGQQIPLLAVRVRVEKITVDGRPARVAFELDDAEDPRLHLVTWDEEAPGFVRVTLPPVGGMLRL